MTAVTNAPLVVDLDGTLTPTDTLVESIVKLVRKNPWSIVLLPFWLLRGRAGFKEAIASRISISAELLPYRQILLDYLKVQKSHGRRIVLATAAHKSIALSVAKHLGIFDQIIATDSGNNLKGSAKLLAVHENIGQSFVYAGDSASDLPIWKAAQAAILVDAPPRIATQVKRLIPVELEIKDESPDFSTWLRALRVHQWLKNLLLFVPLLTAFAFSATDKLLSISIAFIAFSLTASATYLLNDLWDLENDRVHPRKRLRPFASAKIPILHGLAVAAGALTLAFCLAFLVSPNFALTLLLYLALTSVYSFVLKEYVLIDVLMLSLLYTLRILAGSVAIGVAISSWLLAFSVFIFLSLALVKRCAEIVSISKYGATGTSGRDYQVSDLAVLWPLGVGAAHSAVVVFCLFISDPETQVRYTTPHLLWVVAIVLFHWLARIWIKTSRGEMHDDPVVFAIKDRGSRVTVMTIIVVMLAAHFLKLG
jgi:4-hydroxybenzoate polyprenyltransferase